MSGGGGAMDTWERNAGNMSSQTVLGMQKMWEELLQCWRSWTNSVKSMIENDNCYKIWYEMIDR